jgi:hypothetical protein
MSHVVRSRLSLLLLSLLLGLAAVGFASLAADADEDEAPLELGSEHIGMTSEAISKVEEEAHTEQVVEEAIEQSEWSDQDLGYAPEPDCPPVETPPLADPEEPVVQTRAVGVDDYASCVEVAIRSGNGFKAASSVCQTLFPETPAPPPATDDSDVSASATTY